MNNENPRFKNNEERIKYLDEQCLELATNQEEMLVLDFDKAIEESKSEYFNVKLNNKIFKIPSSMPLGFATFFFRNCMHNESFDLDDKDLEKFLDLMFGADFINEASIINVPTKILFEKMAMPILEKWGYNTEQKNQNKAQIAKSNMEKKMGVRR